MELERCLKAEDSGGNYGAEVKSATKPTYRLSPCGELPALDANTKLDFCQFPAQLNKV
jgi:hypothetical protein